MEQNSLTPQPAPPIAHGMTMTARNAQLNPMKRKARNTILLIGAGLSNDLSGYTPKAGSKSVVLTVQMQDDCHFGASTRDVASSTEDGWKFLAFRLSHDKWF